MTKICYLGERCVADSWWWMRWSREGRGGGQLAGQASEAFGARRTGPLARTGSPHGHVSLLLQTQSAKITHSGSEHGQGDGCWGSGLKLRRWRAHHPPLQIQIIRAKRSLRGDRERGPVR